MQIRQFEYALKAAEEGSITRAAEQLYISQQALSESLRLLENELGFPIFQRSRKGVTPTPTGQRFLDDLAAIMPVIDKWRDYAQTGTPKSTVRIYLQYAFRSLLSDSNLLESLDLEDGVSIDWQSLSAFHIIDAFLKDEDSIGIMLLEKAGSVYKQLLKLHTTNPYVIKKAATVSLSIVLRDDDPLTIKNFVNLNDLTDHCFVFHQLSKDLSFNQMILSQKEQKKLQLPEIVDIPTFIAQHENTFGYHIDFPFNNNFLAKHRLVLRPLSAETLASLDLYLLYYPTASDPVHHICERLLSYFI